MFTFVIHSEVACEEEAKRQRKIEKEKNAEIRQKKQEEKEALHNAKISEEEPVRKLIMDLLHEEVPSFVLVKQMIALKRHILQIDTGNNFYKELQKSLKATKSVRFDLFSFFLANVRNVRIMCGI